MTIANKLMYIPNVDTQNYPFCGLQLLIERLGNRSYNSRSLNE